jgi:hypothetical protein
MIVEMIVCMNKNIFIKGVSSVDVAHKINSFSENVNLAGNIQDNDISVSQ